MNLISLSLFQQALGTSNFSAVSGGAIFNVDDIITPIRKMGRSGSYFYTRADRAREHNIIQNGYRVLDSQASIKSQCVQLLSLTVVNRKSKPMNNEVMLFDGRKIFEIMLGIVDPNGLQNTVKFKYQEERNNYFVEYEVSDTLASIYAQTQSGGVTGGNWQIDTAVLTTPTPGNATMTLTQLPSNPTTALLVFQDGQQLNAITDYTIAGNVLTILHTVTAATITTFYQY